MGMGDFLKYISTSDEDRRLEAEEKKAANAALIRKQAIDELAALLKDKNTVDMGDSAIQSTGRQLSAMPPPPIGEDGRKMAKGFFLNDADADAIRGAEQVKSKPGFMPFEDSLAMMRAKAPDVVEDFQKQREGSADLRKREAEIARMNEPRYGIGASSLAGSEDPEFVNRVIEQVDEYENGGILSSAEAKTARTLAIKKPTIVSDYLLSLTKPKTQKQQALGVEEEGARRRASASYTGTATAESSINARAIPGFRPIEGVRITDESVQKVKSIAPDIETMKSLADELISKYQKTGSVFTGDEAADYSSKVRNLQLLAKSPSLYNLGVLTGPDLALLEESIPNPASIKEGMKKQVLGDLDVKLKNFRSLIDKRGNQFYRTNGFEREAGGGSVSGSMQTKVINGKTYTKVNGGWQLKK
jgi:hypothetical protein